MLTDAAKESLGHIYDAVITAYETGNGLDAAATCVLPGAVEDFLDAGVNGWRLMLILAKHFSDTQNFLKSAEYLRPLLRIDLTDDRYPEASGVPPYKLEAQKLMLINLASKGNPKFSLAAAEVFYDLAVGEYKVLNRPDAIVELAGLLSHLKLGVTL